MRGQLSHQLKFQPDDQVNYLIQKTFDPATKSWIIQKMDWKVERGGWGSVAGAILSAVGAANGVPIPPQIGEAVVDKLTDEAAGNWREAAKKTITAIAVKVP